MQTKLIESYKGVPLSELPAGTAFMYELSSGHAVSMVLNTSLIGKLTQFKELEVLLTDLILYCDMDSGFLICIKKSDAKDEYVYPVQPVNGVLEFRP